jgi:hypothetical protein
MTWLRLWLMRMTWLRLWLIERCTVALPVGYPGRADLSIGLIKAWRHELDKRKQQ